MFMVINPNCVTEKSGIAKRAKCATMMVPCVLEDKHFGLQTDVTFRWA
jgi:hypothetical protein